MYEKLPEINTPEDVDRYLSDNYDGHTDDIEEYYDAADVEEYYEGEGEIEEPEEEEVEIEENYEGDDEEFDTFDGKPLKESKSSRRFSFKIKNTGTEDKNVAITPGMYDTRRCARVYNDNGTLKYKLPDGTAVNAPTGAQEGDIICDKKDFRSINAAGVDVDAVLDDGQLSQDVYAASTVKDRTIRSFLEYVKTHPTLITEIHVSVNNDHKGIFEQSLITKRTTPYGTYGEEPVEFQDANKPINPNTSKIIVDGKSFVLDGETLSYLRIPAGTDATITFVTKAVVSEGRKLKKIFKGIKEGTERGIKRIRRVKIRRPHKHQRRKRIHVRLPFWKRFRKHRRRH